MNTPDAALPPPLVFGGIQETSLIDFPGKVACVLFVPGCNFHCPYCHNSELALNRCPPEAALALDRALDFLKARKGFLDGVVISGGEPTLHPALSSVCREIKQLGYPIKLDTNGSRPDTVAALLEARLVDYIAMDIKTVPERYEPVIRPRADDPSIVTSIRLIQSSGMAHEFRTTCINPLVDLAVIEQIARLIQGADLYALQQFHTMGVLDAAYCQESGRRYDDHALEQFRSAAAPWVKRCVIR